MKILIVGTWRENEIDEFREEAIEVGRLLAEKGHSIISGGGKGASAVVVESYRKNNGKEFIVMLPGKEFMDAVGEEPGPKADTTIHSQMDYPQRNITLTRDADAVIGLSGGFSTLVEVITAAKEYKKKVAVIDKGELARHIHALPELKQKILLTKDARKAVEYVTR